MAAVAYEISHDWEDPDGLHELLEAVRDQRDDADVRKIRFAYFVAEQAHAGQIRSSGEPYIHHPLAVARILVDLHMDDDTICAALLHDVLEDCPNADAGRMSEQFGAEVLSLVEGVTKLDLKPQGELTASQRKVAETTRTAETLRKMLLAMAKDFRVMVIKLADRLHNMQTLDALKPEKRTRIANETLDIYAPLAARLGIWQVKWQLEDLAFKHLHPKEFQEVSERVSSSRKERETTIRDAIVAIKERMAMRGLNDVEVNGRPKHLYSIFNKMVKQGVPFEEIYDLLALRVIVPDLQDCYQVLGIVHDLWHPIPGLFYDYIARPKSNGYQSLHTKVVGPSGTPLEVQIRTRKMHEIAEFGVAAHWTYKEGAKGSHDETGKMTRLREQLFDWSTDARLSSDFLRNVSTDLFQEQVFVFTPKGDVIDLPTESTPVDFAFRVHSQLGLTLIGAKVNGIMSPLSTRLSNGDVVELITRSNAQPSLDWLEFVKSAHTKTKLRGYFRKQSKEVDAQRGRDALERELRAMGLDPKSFIGEDKLKEIASNYDGCESSIDVLARLGSGTTSVQNVIAKLRGEIPEPEAQDQIQITRSREGKLTIGNDRGGILVNRGKCCNPIPGDEVMGYVTRGRGIMIHRKVCPNVLNYMATEPERLLAYEWPSDGNVYPVSLKIVSVNRQGLLMDISTIFGESKTNVSAARIQTLPNQTAEIQVTIDVEDTKQLAYVMNRISNFGDVISILRLFGRAMAK